MLMYLLSIFKITQCSQPGNHHLLSFPVGAISFFFIFLSLLFLLSSSEFFFCSHRMYQLLIPAVGGPYLDPIFKIKMSVYPSPFPSPLMTIRGISGICHYRTTFNKERKDGNKNIPATSVLNNLPSWMPSCGSCCAKNKMSWWSQSVFS